VTDSKASDKHPVKKRRSWLRRTLVVMLAVAVLVAAVLIALVWRVSRGPVSLSFLEPRLNRTLASDGTKPGIEIENPVLSWGGRRRPLDLSAGPVRVRDPEGNLMLELEQVSGGLAVGPLLKGVVSPTRIEVRNLQLWLVRAEHGKVSIGVTPAQRGQEKPEARGIGADLDELLDRLLGPSDPTRPLGLLEELSLVDARLTLDDQSSGQQLQVPDIDLELERGPGSVDLSLDVQLALADIEPTVSAEVSFIKSSQRFHIRASVAELVPAVLADLDPLLDRLAVLEFPIDLKAEAELDREWNISTARAELDTDRGRVEAEARWDDDGTVHLGATLAELHPWRFAGPLPELGRLRLPVNASAEARLATDYGLGSVTAEIFAGPGSVDLPEVYPDPVEIRSARIRGGIDGGVGDLRIDQLAFELDGLSIAAALDTDPSGDDVAVTIDASLGPITIETIDRYWPPMVAPEARDWVVTNILEASIDGVTARLGATLPGGRLEGIRIEALTGGFSFDEIALSFLSPLPPAVGISGSGSFSLAEGFHFEVTGGSLLDIGFGPAEVRITGLDDGARTRLFVDSEVDGPVGIIGFCFGGSMA